LLLAVEQVVVAEVVPIHLVEEGLVQLLKDGFLQAIRQLLALVEMAVAMLPVAVVDKLFIQHS
jgi:hypothetical protein